MSEKIDLQWHDVFDRARVLVATQIRPWLDERDWVTGIIYPVPRGGIHAAQAIRAEAAHHQCRLALTDDPMEADFIVDDIIDTGATRTRHDAIFHKPFLALVDKPREKIDKWVTFPWERMENDSGPENNIIRILQYIGEDPKREGLLETPRRVVKSYAELFSGYQYTDEKIAEMLKVFEDGACQEMVIVEDISFTSFCEHHMLPFTGTASVGYIPNKRVIGLSKIPRLVEVYSRRLQLQERLTEQITQALDKYLQPEGSACVVQASHSCMSCRGVRQSGATMKTSSLTGRFLEAAVRQEFFSLIGK